MTTNGNSESFLSLIKLLNHSDYVAYDDDVIPTVVNAFSNHPTNSMLIFSIADWNDEPVADYDVNETGYINWVYNGSGENFKLTVNKISLQAFGAVHYLIFEYDQSQNIPNLTVGSLYADVTFSPVLLSFGTASKLRRNLGQIGKSEVAAKAAISTLERMLEREKCCKEKKCIVKCEPIC